MAITRKDQSIIATAIRFSLRSENERHQIATEARREVAEQIAAMLALNYENFKVAEFLDQALAKTEEEKEKDSDDEGR